MSNDTTRDDRETRPRLSDSSGPLPASDDVRECPIGADGRFTSAAQVPAGVTDAQIRAIELLLAGTSQAKVAQACGVDVRTVYRWRHECEPFRAAMDHARREIWTGTVDRMRGMIATSLDVLEEELVDVYDRSRVRAATIVLAHSNVRKLMQADMAERDAR